jgi:AAA domain-containing protein
VDAREYLLAQAGIYDNKATAPIKSNGAARRPPVLSISDFIGTFTPPEYVIAGILQRRFIYALTGLPGAGKTAIMLSLAAHVALGRNISPEHEVEKGRVLYLAGENPVDIQMRLIAMAQQYDFVPDDAEISIVPGTFLVSEMRDYLDAEVEGIGGVSLVFVDTSSAFFEGEDENSNKQAGDHARMLRELTKLPGEPCVVVACHPVKNASENNLQPRGGGAFLGEVDGNLTAKNDEGSIELHWQGKFRGPDFAPISFKLEQVTHQDLKDRHGRMLPTVIARHLSDVAKENIAAAYDADRMKFMQLIAKYPKASLAELATMMDWLLSGSRPNKLKAQRMASALVKAKAAEKTVQGKLKLTKAGEMAVSDAGSGVSNTR